MRSGPRVHNSRAAPNAAAMKNASPAGNPITANGNSHAKVWASTKNANPSQ